MNLTFNLILALFLLAPGLGLFAGVYSGDRKPFSPAPPEPGSVQALALVSMGALALHTIWALGFAYMQSRCETGRCLSVPFQPNIYSTLLAFRTSPGTNLQAPAIATADLTWLLVALLMIGASGFVVGYLVVPLIRKTGLLRSSLFGWIDGLLSIGPTKAHVFNCYVVTDTEVDGRLLGYEGALVDMRQTASGEIRSVVLAECQPFLIDLKNFPTDRAKRAEEKPLRFILIEGANIKNIAFQVYLDTAKLTVGQRRKMEAAGDIPGSKDETALASIDAL